MDELKHLDTEGLKDIEIPDGLENRLSMMIDQLGKSEKGMTAKKVRLRIIQAISAVACIAIVFAATTLFSDKTAPAHKDTFDNPETACREAEKALSILAYNLGKGVEHLEKVKEISERTNNTINRTIEKLGNNE